MSLHLHQTINASGYITDAKYLYGTVSDFEYHLGYEYGRLHAGFFVGHLITLPEEGDFDTRAYSQIAEQHYKTPTGLDMNKIKSIAKQKMADIGVTHLVKVFPVTRFDPSRDLDEQFPPGAGIPQWKLKNELPFYIFKEVEAHYKGTIYLF